MSAARLRDQVLPAGVDGTLVKATLDGVYAGHVFSCRWTYGNGTNSMRVCWVTQLVVHRDYRERGLATHMLRMLRDNTVESAVDRNDTVGVFGILSSQPAACLALARAVGGPGDLAPLFPSYLSFTCAFAQAIFAASPVPYVRGAKVGGAQFTADPTESVQPAHAYSPSAAGGDVSVADTQFFVDHAEPCAALTRFRTQRGHPFPLGDNLPAGHEFLLLVPH